MKSTCLFSFAALCLFPAVSPAQTTSYSISTVAGNATPGFFGDGSAATSANLNTPIAVAVDSSHNIYIADSANNRIRKVTQSTGKISTIAGNGTALFTGDGGAATSASLNTPYGVAVDGTGNVYISDLLDHVVRKVNTSGTISTIAGTNAYGFSGDGGPGTSAQLNQPFGLALDSANANLYIADSNNYCVRKLNLASGIITTVAGLATNIGYSGDGGPATSAKMNPPYGIAVDSAGNLYIADAGNNRIRKVSNGIITTLAGTGTKGFTGDNGPAAKAELNRPFGVSVDALGNVYVSDYGNYRVRLVSTNGVITTLAGFAPGYGGDGGPAINATLEFPTGAVSDPQTGNVYIADSGNNVIRQMAPSTPAIGSGGVISASAFGAFPAVAPGSWIEIYGANLATNVRSWNSGDFNGLSAPTSLDGNSVTIGGQPAFPDYISGGQINVQVPSNVGTGQQQIVVKNSDGGSATATVTVNAAEPGLYAPSSLVVGGKQYAGAFFSDGTTYAIPPGAVAGITSRRANPGDTITFYGVGFGPVTPAIPAGQIAMASNALPSFQMQLGGTAATVMYAGLAPDAVGLYQFNVVVPSNAVVNDLTPVTFTLNGTPNTQTLYIAIQ